MDRAQRAAVLSLPPIVRRSEWATRLVQQTVLPVQPATGVVIHHAVSALEGSTIDTDNDGLSDSFERLLREIEDFHLDARGWRGGIAYNTVVGHRAGRKAEGRGWGLQGGATGDPDDRFTHSICALGNYEGVHEATDELVRNIAEVIALGIVIGRLVPLEQLRIYSHHEKPFPTACCGRNLIARLPEVRPLVATILAGGEDTLQLTPENLARGWERYPQDPDVFEFVRSALAELGFAPGGSGANIERAIRSFKTQYLPGDVNDALVRRPFWQALIGQLTGGEVNQTLRAELIRKEALIRDAVVHIDRAKNALS